MDQELLVVTTAGDVLGHDKDVFCVVSHRMHSLHPNAGPSLALSRQRYLAVPTRAPTEWEAPTPFKQERADKLLQLAELVHGHACPAVVSGWLGTVATPVGPAHRYTGNVYFGHVPNMSCRMLVNFQAKASTQRA